ncbi:MAG: Rpn family recombination-promoting nuclease/putative transposase [Bacteroidales bacterium]|nr:Rpn family recombination-promoting nuclease/putative transposase [Bacteroidales bacterium]
MRKYLDPKADVTFKKVFGEHPNLIISLLNALLPLPQDMQIVSIEYLSSELVPMNPTKKDTIVDVRCKDNFNRQFIVEMQMYWTDAFFKRSVLNACKAYSTQAKKGQAFETLQPVYALCLLNESGFPNYLDQDKNLEYIQELYLINKNHPEFELQEMGLIFVELQKFKPSNYAHKKLKELWLKFLTEIKDNTTEISAELLENKEISEALEYLETSAYTEAELTAYDKYWDLVSREKTIINEKTNKAREEGRKEGREEGETNKAFQIAKMMKANNEPLEKIINYTGLSKEEIEKILS